MKKKLTLEQALVENFNLKHPIGTRVLVWPMLKEGDGQLGVTTTEAMVSSAGYGVVYVRRDGKAQSSFSLSHVEAVQP